jgi:hypothetical protein
MCGTNCLIVCHCTQKLFAHVLNFNYQFVSLIGCQEGRHSFKLSHESVQGVALNDDARKVPTRQLNDRIVHWTTQKLNLFFHDLPRSEGDVGPKGIYSAEEKILVSRLAKASRPPPRARMVVASLVLESGIRTLT